MSIILYRTHKFDGEARAFCERLEREAGRKVVCLVDETRKPADVSPFAKVSVTRQALKDHGLRATADAAWRCGDYGLYLAMSRYPDVEQFWLVEYDVRIRVRGSLSDFFASFDESRADLIAPLVSERDASWWWYPTMQAGSQPVWGCLFPLLRVSSALLRDALQARKDQAKSPVYRLFWPNDESFLATIAARRAFIVQDLNDVRPCYTAESFSFERPWSGVELEHADLDDLVYHPVLYGEDLERKLAKLAKPSSLQEKVQRKMRAALSGIA